MAKGLLSGSDDKSDKSGLSLMCGSDGKSGLKMSCLEVMVRTPS